MNRNVSKTVIVGQNADQQTASTDGSESIFKMIEAGQYREIEELMGAQKGQSETQLNMSASNSEIGSNAEGSMICPIPKCVRHDYNFTALAFACYSNQAECFKVIYEHAWSMARKTEQRTFN